MSRRHNKEFSLIWIQFELVHYHPRVYVINTLGEFENGTCNISRLVRVNGNVNLNVISVQMVAQVVMSLDRNQQTTTKYIPCEGEALSISNEYSNSVEEVA